MTAFVILRLSAMNIGADPESHTENRPAGRRPRARGSVALPAADPAGGPLNYLEASAMSATDYLINSILVLLACGRS